MRRHIEPDLLYGLVIVGALILLLFTSFIDLLPAPVAAATGTQGATEEPRPIRSLDSAVHSPPPA